MKTKITNKLLIKNNKSFIKTFCFSLFIIAGVAAIISPLFVGEDLKSCLPVMALTSLLGIPFCWLGLKNILSTFKINTILKNGGYIVVEDEVSYRRMTHKGRHGNTTDMYCQLSFKNHSDKTGEAVFVRRSVYNETHKGDKFYLIYIGEELIGYYPMSKFEI